MTKIRYKGRFQGCKAYQRFYFVDMAKLRVAYTKVDQELDGNAGLLTHGKSIIVCLSKTKAWAFESLDGRAKTAFEFEDVSEVRDGHTTDTFQDVIKDGPYQTVNLSPEKCFSIIFHGKRAGQTLDLALEDESVKDMWIQALRTMLRTLRETKQRQRYEQLVGG